MLPQIRREPSLLLNRAAEKGIKGEFGVENSEKKRKNPSDFRTTFTDLQRVRLRLLLRLTQWITNFVPPCLVSARIYFLFSGERDAFTHNGNDSRALTFDILNRRRRKLSRKGA